MLSAVYQQSSEDSPSCRAKDPENRLLWRQNRQRLDLEAMRDSLEDELMRPAPEKRLMERRSCVNPGPETPPPPPNLPECRGFLRP